MTRSELHELIPIETAKGMPALKELGKVSGWKQWDYWIEIHTVFSVYCGEAVGEINRYAIMGKVISDSKLIYLMDLLKQVEMILCSLNKNQN